MPRSWFFPQFLQKFTFCVEVVACERAAVPARRDPPAGLHCSHPREEANAAEEGLGRCPCISPITKRKAKPSVCVEKLPSKTSIMLKTAGSGKSCSILIKLTLAAASSV